MAMAPGTVYGGRSAGRVFGLGRTPDEIAAQGQAMYPSYSGEWVWAYQSEFPQLDFENLAPGTTFADLVAQGVLTRDDVLAGFNVDPTFAAQNPANIDNGIMRTDADAIAPADQGAYNTAYQTDSVTAATKAAATAAAPVDPTTQVFLQNGQNVDGNGTPYPPGSAHYYNALLDMIQQTEAQGGTRGAVTVAEAALAKSNPALVDDLPPDVLQAYGTAFNAVLHPASVPAGSTGGPSGVTSGPASGSSSGSSSGSGAPAPTVGGGSSGQPGDMPQPSANPFGVPPSDAGAGGATGGVSLAAGVPGGIWGLLAVAAVGLAVVSGKPGKQRR